MLYLISEIGLNHNGNLDLAKELIYQSALNGATFVKFQKRFPNNLAIDEFLDAPFNKCPAFCKFVFYSIIVKWAKWNFKITLIIFFKRKKGA